MKKEQLILWTFVSIVALLSNGQADKLDIHGENDSLEEEDIEERKEIKGQFLEAKSYLINVCASGLEVHGFRSGEGDIDCFVIAKLATTLSSQKNLEQLSEIADPDLVEDLLDDAQNFEKAVKKAQATRSAQRAGDMARLIDPIKTKLMTICARSLENPTDCDGAVKEGMARYEKNRGQKIKHQQREQYMAKLERIRIQGPSKQQVAAAKKAYKEHFSGQPEIQSRQTTSQEGATFSKEQIIHKDQEGVSQPTDARPIQLKAGQQPTPRYRGPTKPLKDEHQQGPAQAAQPDMHRQGGIPIRHQIALVNTLSPASRDETEKRREPVEPEAPKKSADIEQERAKIKTDTLAAAKSCWTAHATLAQQQQTYRVKIQFTIDQNSRKVQNKITSRFEPKLTGLYKEDAFSNCVKDYFKNTVFFQGFLNSDEPVSVDFIAKIQ